MADLSPGVQLAQRLDERYAQALERRVNDRATTQDAQAQSTNAQRAAEQARDARAARDLDEQRSLDAEQQLRDQQLREDLRRAEENRQAAQDTTAQGTGPAPRGSFLDVIA